MGQDTNADRGGLSGSSDRSGKGHGGHGRTLTRCLAADSNHQCPRPASWCAQLMVYLTMAEVPPWPSFSFNGITLLCPIITWLLLLIFLLAIDEQLGCLYKSGGTLLHHQRRTVQHCCQPRKKKSTAATPAVISALMTQLAILTEMNVTL